MFKVNSLIPELSVSDINNSDDMDSIIKKN